MSIPYNIVRSKKGATVTAFIGGEPFVATNDHPRFDDIVKELTSKQPKGDRLKDLFDVSASLERSFVDSVKRFVTGAPRARITKRVVVKGGKLFYDGQQLDNALAQLIVRYHNEGNDDLLPLVRFMEKLYANPSQESLEQFYQWLSHLSFQLADDGDLIAYKSVDDDFLSFHSGYAIVNGQPVNGRVPNAIGNVIEIPRERVDSDPWSACSVGLHVGTWDYSYRQYRGKQMILVKIDPRDIVSVPQDSAWQKMRVCRYTVVAVTPEEAKHLRATVSVPAMSTVN